MKNHRFLVRNTSVRTLPPKILRITYTPPSPSYCLNQRLVPGWVRGVGGGRGNCHISMTRIEGTRSRFVDVPYNFFTLERYQEPLSRKKRLCLQGVNNMRTLKLKAQPTNACFATVNQMFGGSSQLPTTAERAVIKSLSTVHTTKTVPSSSRNLGIAAEHLIVGSKKRICRLSFEF